MYKIEVRWGRYNGNLEWSETVCMLTAEKAIKLVREKANLARIVCDVQAIANDRSHVIAKYNPDDDMRLPGCRCIRQAQLADQILIKNGREDLTSPFEEKTIWWDRFCNKDTKYNTPEFDAIWAEAEQQLPDTDGFWAMNEDELKNHV